jgi:putative addiction module component (TIGR02574 family)
MGSNAVGTGLGREKRGAQISGHIGEERAHLADRLLASLSNDAEVEEAWAVEVERRIADIESGPVELLPVADAIGRAHAALK